MDIEGRLHSGQHRSQMTMMNSDQTVHPADRASDNEAIRKRQPRSPWVGGALAWALACGLGSAQQASPTGPQQLTFAGLRAVTNQSQPSGQIDAVQTNAAGDLYLLINQGDGVRVIETNSTASTVLNSAYIGAKFDIGLAMALDPAGNVYVTGTTGSGSLTATSGAAFPAASGTATNSFVAKFGANLGNPLFVTFCGGGFMDAGSIAATGDAVFVTGTHLQHDAAGDARRNYSDAGIRQFVEWVCGEVFRVGQFPALRDVPQRRRRQHLAGSDCSGLLRRCVHRGNDHRAGLSDGGGASAKSAGDAGAGRDYRISDQADADR